MTHTTLEHRRLLLKLLAGSTLPMLGWNPARANETPVLHVLRDRLTLITGAGGNVVVFRGNTGLTLIDSGLAGKTAELLTQVAGISPNSPVSTLFNTHWHADHTGGNEAVHALGAEIIAHENTKLWLGADFDVEWRQTSHKPRPGTAWPDTTFYESGAKDLGGETVQYIHNDQAHTDGDIFLFFPDSNVLVAGGLFSAYRYPICDIATGGWIGGLLKANESMLTLADDNTLIVPDRGPALRKADLQAQYDMLSNLYTKMKELAQNGYSGRDMLQEKITTEYDSVWGNPEEFVLETYRGMWAHTYDMGGFI